MIEMQGIEDLARQWQRCEIEDLAMGGVFTKDLEYSQHLELMRAGDSMWWDGFVAPLAV